MSIMRVIAFKHFIHVDSCSDSNCSELVGWVLSYIIDHEFTQGQGAKWILVFPAFEEIVSPVFSNEFFFFLRFQSQVPSNHRGNLYSIGYTWQLKRRPETAFLLWWSKWSGACIDSPFNEFFLLPIRYRQIKSRFINC